LIALLTDPAAQAVLHASLAWLFLRSARHKARDLGRFRTALADYRVLPERAVAAVARGIPALEGGVAIALVIPGLGPGPAVAGAGLLLVYASAIAVNLERGRDEIDCGCGAPGDERSIGLDLVVRNTLLAVLALGAALPASARALTWLDLASVGAAIVAVAALLAAAEHALVNARRLRTWRNPA
jgi:hypothetical protein